MTDGSSVSELEPLEEGVHPEEPDAPVEMAFSWSTLLRLVLVGVVSRSSSRSRASQIGAIVAGWITGHVEVASTHPVPVALLTTVAAYVVVIRAVPWRRLLGSFPRQTRKQTTASTTTEKRCTNRRPSSAGCRSGRGD